MSDWKTTKLREGLLNTIDQAVGQIKEFGIPKYDSTPDFIQRACIQLLRTEGYEVKEEATAQ